MASGHGEVRGAAHAARNAGTTVTLDMEDHTTTDSTLRILHELRKDFPQTGGVLQAYLRRTEDDSGYRGRRRRLRPLCRSHCSVTTPGASGSK